MIRLALLRHGHTPWNRAGQIQGRTDIALDPEAAAQLSKLRLPDDWQHVDIWSSPLMRAKQTAQIVTDRSPKTDPALTEMDWGTWEGQKGIELKADPASGFKDIEDWGWDFAPPRGETVAAVRERLLPWAQGLQKDTLAVCHIGVMRVFLAHAFGWDFAGPPPFQIKRNRFYVIEIENDIWNPVADPIRLQERVA